MLDENKSKALKGALAEIEKQFGKGAVMRLEGDKVTKPEISVIPGAACVASRKAA